MYRMKKTFNFGVMSVVIVLVVGVVAAMNFSIILASAQTMMPGNQTTSGKTMTGNTTGSNTTASMMKGNLTSSVPTPVGPPGP
jgi:hypothetical protein